MSRLVKILFLLLGVVPFNVVVGVGTKKSFCPGTDFQGWERFEQMKKSSLCVDYYKHRYEGCTHIVGNFELLSTHNDRQVSFLRDIEEISGYLLLHNVAYYKLSFPNLRIIRGESQFRLNPEDVGYALLMMVSDIDDLTFPELREVTNESVGFFTDKRMCTLEDMNWNDILEGEGAQYQYFPNDDNITGVHSPLSQNAKDDGTCKNCDSSCQDGCWGQGLEKCQKLSKIGCSQKCQGGRCFGPAPSECCHSLCSAGCSGPTAKDCFSCKYVFENGECRNMCSENKLSFGSSCVDTCPRNTFLDEELDASQAECPDDKREENGICRRLLPSERKCRHPSHRWPEIHSGNIGHFRNCTFLNGDIYINEKTLSGELNYFHNLTYRSRQARMDSKKLEIFSTLKEITGTLQIKGEFGGSKRMSFFRNLEVIGSQNAPCISSEESRLLDSLRIFSTDFEAVDLKKLRLVHGDIGIIHNEELCFVDELYLGFIAIAANGGTYYKEENKDEGECRKEGHICSNECSVAGCWGPQPKDCICMNYRQEGLCVDRCNLTEGYLADALNCERACPVGKFNDGGICKWCHGKCEKGCTGGGSKLGISGCNSCRHKTLQYSNGTAVCMRKSYKDCPDGFSLRGRSCFQIENVPSNKSTDETDSKQSQSTLWIALGCIFGVVLLATGATIGFKMHFRKRRRASNPKKKEAIPLVTPNLSKFRIIDEKDLRRDEELGSGAFGKVFRGIWMPEEKRTLKIPVAIKILRGAAGAKESASLVDEAYLMAGVQHPNLLQLLALCLSSSEIMLVTQLMPLGCLQKYLRANRDQIGAGTMLSWITQIAKGMEYLESRRIVHRDLAARNVLVETPSTVKITDFGLAKLLGFRQEKCEEDGKKLPVKWLALECFKTHTFSHKSDVWAFGVTVWEILTCGGNPYSGVAIHDILPLLEGGRRLEQPENCTIEMRMVLVKTSMPDPESRPSFGELVATLEEMCEDPCRYIVIPDDGQLQLPEYTHEDELQLLYSLASKCDRPEELITVQDYAMLPEVSPALDHLGYLIPESQSNLQEPLDASVEFDKSLNIAPLGSSEDVDHSQRNFYSASETKAVKEDKEISQALTELCMEGDASEKQ